MEPIKKSKYFCDEENYYALVRSSPSYGNYPDERDDDEKIYSEKDIKFCERLAKEHDRRPAWPSVCIPEKINRAKA